MMNMLKLLKNLDIIIPMYNLIEYSNKYADSTILLSLSLQLVLKNMVILSVWVKTLKNISDLVFLSKKILKTTNQ